MRALRVAILLASCAGCDSFSEGAPPDSNDASAGAETGADDAASDAPSATPALAYSAAVAADGPIAYWRMGDAISSPTADDAVANHDAILSSTPPKFGSPGLFGSASGSLLFDGKSGTYVASDTLPFVGIDAFTIELWIFLASPLDATFRNIVYHGSGDAAYGLFVQQDAGIGVSRIENGLKTSVQTNSAPSTNTWHHVVAVRGVTLTLYVDETPFAVPITGPDQAAASVFFLGAKSGTALSLPNGTRVTEVAVYDKALPLLRVVDHHKLGAP